MADENDPTGPGGPPPPHPPEGEAATPVARAEDEAASGGIELTPSEPTEAPPPVVSADPSEPDQAHYTAAEHAEPAPLGTVEPATVEQAPFEASELAPTIGPAAFEASEPPPAAEPTTFEAEPAPATDPAPFDTPEPLPAAETAEFDATEPTPATEPAPFDVPEPPAAEPAAFETPEPTPSVAPARFAVPRDGAMFGTLEQQPAEPAAAPEPPVQPDPPAAESAAFEASEPTSSVAPPPPAVPDDGAMFGTLEQQPAGETAAAPEPPVQPEPPATEPPPAPRYFAAAGDPYEPDAPLKMSVGDRLDTAGRSFWSRFKPGWFGFWRTLGELLFGIRERIRDVHAPRTVREAAVWSGWTAAVGVAAIVGFFFFVTWGMPSTDDLWEARQGQSITFLDRNGHVILREGAQNAPPVDLTSLPPYVAQAFIAIEDRRFYDHLGVDFGGMMRAGAENIRAGRVVQGGSTITQQLAKNLFLTNERSWRRKAQEIMLAFWLESRFSKDEILALYLSRVYFGAGAYGVEAAAERYFDRPARQLTLLQSAVLAGLVKAPSRLNPARQDFAAARERAITVLDEMVMLEFIGASERDAALQEQLEVSRSNPAGVLSYYRDWIDPLLNEVIGYQRDDFIIETTIDIAAQRAAAESVEMVLAEQGEERRVGQAAALVMDDRGGVRAMVGGRDYDQSQFNRATQARRQPGSSFKYFIYIAAMENGLTPWTIREDAPITIYIPGQPPWSPGNYEDEYHGAVTLSGAFAHSFNMVAIRVANEVGGQKVIDVARRLGVASPLHNYHSLALGAQEMTLMEMVGAYGAMASGGYRTTPHGVTRIRRANSTETMWLWRSENERVIEERPLRYMNLLMSRVVESGTGTRARMETFQIGGKTGTGNDYRDAWFVGFTPGMVGGVWAGNDNFTETARVTGGSLPAEIWARFMPVALRDLAPRPLEMPTEEDFDLGIALIEEAPRITAVGVGAPIGAVVGAPAAPPPPDNEDRSLDFGPEG